MKELTIAIIVIILVTLGVYGYKHHEFCISLYKEQNDRQLYLLIWSFDECMKTQKNVMFCAEASLRSKKFLQAIDYEELKDANCHP